jgi:L-fucose isomerase-like protein
MGKILRRYNVPFTYLINSPLGAKSFEEGYKAFCAVCSVVKTFKRIRVMQVSVRPDPFWSVICNEGELLEKYGIQVFPVTLQQVKEEIDAMAGTPEEADTVEYLRGVMNLPDAPADPLNRVARLYLAIRSLGRKNNCTSAAVQCWGPMQKTAGASICTVNGLLTDEGMPVACEMDVLGAVTMEIQQATCLNAKPVFFADMTIRHPTNPNAELLWHCGNFPPSLACDPAQRSMILEEPPGQNEWEIKHGDITICRFDGDHGEYSLMMGEGKGVDGPKTNGTYSWFEVDDWPKWEKHLVTGPYVHHCAGVHAKTAAILYEACKYMGVVPDPINPTADRIERFWREGV